MKNKKFCYKEGFTLIELLVVVAIIGILVAVAVPQFAAYKMKVNNALCKADIGNLAKSLEAYYVDNSSYANATLANLAAGYSLTQSQIGGVNACTITDPPAAGNSGNLANSWQATSVWAAGGTGTVTYAWISDGGGIQ